MSETQGLRPESDARATAPSGRREAGKTERRQRIIRAARQLIRQTGNAGLSMRALAVRAGVSLATPYNLFGSKRAIVLAVRRVVARGGGSAGPVLDRDRGRSK